MAELAYDKAKAENCQDNAATFHAVENAADNKLKETQESANKKFQANRPQVDYINTQEENIKGVID